MSARHFRTILGCTVFIISLSSGQPKLVLEKQEIDLGTIYNGATVKARVKLTNGGSNALMVESIRTSCGCTTVKQPKEELKPNESDMVEVEFNSSGIRGDVKKYVYIETNDPVNRYTTVTLSVSIREELEPVSSVKFIWFGDVAVGKPAKLTYTLKNIGESKISIKGVGKAYEKLAVEYDKSTVSPGDSVVVSISVVASRVGYFSETFTLNTDSKKQPKVPILYSFVGVNR